MGVCFFWGGGESGRSLIPGFPPPSPCQSLEDVLQVIFTLAVLILAHLWSRKAENTCTS